MNLSSINYKIIKNRKINIALVGCGRISNNHLKTIFNLNKKLRLVALCDSKKERLEVAEKTFNDLFHSKKCEDEIFLFEDFSKLIYEISTKKVSIDLLVLATPSGLHASQTIAAANVGVHVCTEKPISTNWEDGLEMVEFCEKKGVRLFVVKQNRFNSTVKLVKKQIDKKRFGKLSIIQSNVFWQRPQSYYDQDSWRGTWLLDGGALMNQASHYVDLLEWLGGPVESVNANIATIGRDIEAEDTATLNLRWQNGAIGTMAVTMLTYPSNLEGSITILGEKGSVKIGGKAVNDIEYWHFADQSEDDLLVKQSNYETQSIYGFGHPLYYENMVEVLEGKSHPMCDGRSGLRSLELLISAYKSAKEGKTIFLNN